MGKPKRKEDPVIQPKTVNFVYSMKYDGYACRSGGWWVNPNHKEEFFELMKRADIQPVLCTTMDSF